jgi:hypothetical protein
LAMWRSLNSTLGQLWDGGSEVFYWPYEIQHLGHVETDILATRGRLVDLVEVFFGHAAATKAELWPCEAALSSGAFEEVCHLKNVSLAV